MKIAQIAPLYESVPPKLYGGTERIVSYLTEEFEKRFSAQRMASDYLMIYEGIRSGGEASEKVTALPQAA